ncbi:MAG: DNA methylase [Chloroflexi bacterium]|nr:DNA methylase [Chloroflexota bacterium]
MSEQLPLFNAGTGTTSGTSGSAAYRERLREYLHDPAFRSIEGFPHGDDDHILALSDAPYYTACPNPFLGEIVARWRGERAKQRLELDLPDDSDDNGNASQYPVSKAPTAGSKVIYRREPFAVDVSEGKSDPVYSAHGYYTKVPHKAIMRYVLHYTDPGDIVFDGFCGTGMTGVAAQLCGDRDVVESLGYFVDGDGVVKDGDRMISRIGARKAILVDLSPAATFIAYNYNTPVDTSAFEREARRIMREVEQELGWMYETWHPRCDAPDRVKGRIRYTVWSEVFLCPQCSGEITFLDEALDTETLRVKEEFPCPYCGAVVSKRNLERCRVTAFDPVLGRTVESLKRRPVIVEYRVGSTKYQKHADEHDLELLDRIARLPPPDRIPSNPLPIPQMYHGSRLAPKGVTHLHQFFLPRSAHALHGFWGRSTAVADPRLRSFLEFTVDQTIWGMSLLNRYQPIQFGRAGGSQVNRYLSGVYYISSLISEVSPWYILEGKVGRLARAFASLRYRPGSVAIATQSASVPPPAEGSVDYIFTDPPFGENIYYADLNYLVESWYGVVTNSSSEAIIDQAKRKDLYAYQRLMKESFRSFYRWLKPGRWMTVEFHNSRNAVWNAIQEAILAAGFVVADVRTLDKRQGSYRQVTAATAAKQDLVISAYKPRTGFERRFLVEAGTPEGAWDFVRQHLAQLPTVVERNGVLEVVAERQPHLLFDRMVAFHVQRGAAVPLSAAELYAGLRQRFVERDGTFFLADQVPEYDRARMHASRIEQLALFVDDEKSAIQWLRRQVDPSTGGRPQTYQEILPLLMRQLHQAPHETFPELSEILEQNFLQDGQGRWYVPDPNRASDLEKMRQKALLREFNSYVESRGRLRQFRTEAVRAGFADALRRHDYSTIVQVAERLPQNVLQEDPVLLMYYDSATLRVR